MSLKILVIEEDAEFRDQLEFVLTDPKPILFKNKKDNRREIFLACSKEYACLTLRENMDINFIVLCLTQSKPSSIDIDLLNAIRSKRRIWIAVDEMTPKFITEVQKFKFEFLVLKKDLIASLKYEFKIC